MMQADLKAYKNSYLVAARERLGNLKKGLSALKDNPNNQELISDIHLNIHTLRTQNDVMGYGSTGSLCRLIENFFYELKENNSNFSSDKIALINNAISKIEESVSQIENTGQELDLSSEENILKANFIL